MSSTEKPTMDGRFRVRVVEFKGGGDVAPPPPLGWLREYRVQFVVCGV